VRELRRVEFVGPQVGKELAENGAMALLLVIIGIMIYLAFRFEWRFSVSAIIANLHDVVIILGFFAFFQWEFSLSVLAAVLAVLGYSVNESVVVFDRVRETFKKVRGLTTPEVLDHAITSTISRTIITHGSTQLMVLSMLIFGGEVLYYFSLALTIGICFGIYSSVLVASPLVMWLGVSREQFITKTKVIEGANEDGAVVFISDHDRPRAPCLRPRGPCLHPRVPCLHPRVPCLHRRVPCLRRRFPCLRRRRAAGPAG
jgi:preprotein translocase subunit SecF